MQRDYWFTSERNPARLESAESVGRTAGEHLRGMITGYEEVDDTAGAS